MNDIADGLEAAAYAAKAAGVELASSSDASFSAKMRKLSNSVVFSSFNGITAASGSSLAEKRSIAVVSGVDAGEVSSAASMRLPVVIVSKSCRDIGSVMNSDVIIFVPERPQELLDNVVQAYRVCEDNKVLLPAIVAAGNWETREVVQVPTEQAVGNMLPRLRLPAKVDVKKPASFNMPFEDTERDMQKSKAVKNVPEVLEKTFGKWEEKFRRKYGMLESYMMEDAEYAFVAAGFDSSAVRDAVKSLRASGEKVGMLRLRVVRPMPPVQEALKGKKVAVIDSCGLLAGLSGELKLETGGKTLTEKDVSALLSKLKKSETGTLWL
ncbi:MAG: hypothetical protein HYT73_02005 [Candidatus Aenigmarchaeota archaeon]|nr:hypothetical protein [Candidatus Aenigmarchaeota archaeon]